MRFSMTFSAKMPVRTAKRSFSSLPTGSNIIKRQINVVSVEILSLMSACALCLSLRRLLRSMSLSLGARKYFVWSSIAVSRRLADNSSVSDIAISHNWCHKICSRRGAVQAPCRCSSPSSARLSMEVFARSSCRIPRNASGKGEDATSSSCVSRAHLPSYPVLSPAHRNKHDRQGYYLDTQFLPRRFSSFGIFRNDKQSADETKTPIICLLWYSYFDGRFLAYSIASFMLGRISRDSAQRLRWR